MKVNSVKIVNGKVQLVCERKSFYLTDGIYCRNDGQAITVKNNQIIGTIGPINPKVASKALKVKYLKDLEEQLLMIVNENDRENFGLLSAIQKQQQLIQLLSTMSKTLHDQAMAIIQNMR